MKDQQPKKIAIAVRDIVQKYHYEKALGEMKEKLQDPHISITEIYEEYFEAPDSKKDWIISELEKERKKFNVKTSEHTSGL